MSISPPAATMWSWVYCRLRQGALGAPHPAASVPWPDTQARLAVCAHAAAPTTDSVSDVAAVARMVLIMLPSNARRAKRPRQAEVPSDEVASFGKAPARSRADSINRQLRV